MHISAHCKTQAQIRHLQSELAEGMLKVDSTRLPDTVSGEVNFIVEKKRTILHRKGSSGDIVVIGIDWNRKVVKSIFLQNQDQVSSRQAKGRQYCSLLHK